MDIHKPKPWHGFREFLKEYLIIVVGVLTALGAEQVVEQLHWRHEVETAREALRFDLKRTVGTAAAQDAHTVCTARRLDELSALLDEAAATHRLRPLGWNGPPPGGSWTLRSWSALNSGQTLPHFPNREQYLLGAMELVLERQQETRHAEIDDWSTLRILAGPGRSISEAEIAAARVALAHAYQDASRLRDNARSVETLVVQSHLLSAADLKAAYDDGIALNATSFVCKPLPPASAGVSENQRHDLHDPPVRPGDTQITNPGVGHAVTLEK